jgi:hypothetical protein
MVGIVTHDKERADIDGIRAIRLALGNPSATVEEMRGAMGLP